MDTSLIQTLVAIVMAGVVVAIILGIRNYLAANSERRMHAMLESVGLDPEIARKNQIPTILKEVRERCRNCATEAVCERWLKGKKEGGNDFCPNAKVFEVLRKYDRAA